MWLQSHCFLAVTATSWGLRLRLAHKGGSLSPWQYRMPARSCSHKRGWSQRRWLRVPHFLGLGAKTKPRDLQLRPPLLLAPTAAADPSSAPHRVPGLVRGRWVWSGVAAGLLPPLPAPLPVPAPSRGPWPLLAGAPLPHALGGLDPQGCALCPWGSPPGYPGAGAGTGAGVQPSPRVLCLLWGRVLPAAHDGGAACMVLPAPSLPPARLSASPCIQPRGAAATSPALFALGLGSGRSGTDQAHESCPRSLPPTAAEPPRGPRRPVGMRGGEGTAGSPGSAPPFHPRTRMRPLFSLAAPRLQGPALAGGGGKEKPSFVLLEENWGFCFPGNGAAKAKPGGCRCCTKPAVSPSHSPGRSNRLPRPGISCAGAGASGRTRSFNSSSGQGWASVASLSSAQSHRPGHSPKPPRSLGQGVDVGLGNPDALKPSFWDNFVPAVGRCWRPGALHGAGWVRRSPPRLPGGAGGGWSCMAPTPALHSSTMQRQHLGPVGCR